MDENAPQWVALAVVQSYNPRRKVPRSNISIPDLEQCLLKASFSAAQNSGNSFMHELLEESFNYKFLCCLLFENRCTIPFKVFASILPKHHYNLVALTHGFKQCHLILTI